MSHLLSVFVGAAEPSLSPSRAYSPHEEDHAYFAEHGHGRHAGGALHYLGARCSALCPTAAESLRPASLVDGPMRECAKPIRRLSDDKLDELREISEIEYSGSLGAALLEYTSDHGPITVPWSAELADDLRALESEEGADTSLVTLERS